MVLGIRFTTVALVALLLSIVIVPFMFFEEKVPARMPPPPDPLEVKLGAKPIRAPGQIGKVYAVERYLEQVAHDPDSVDIVSCTRTLHSESAWVVGCDYRARNAFGGLVLTSSWFRIRKGLVIGRYGSMLEAMAE